MFYFQDIDTMMQKYFALGYSISPGNDVADESPLHAIGLDSDESTLLVASGDTVNWEKTTMSRSCELSGDNDGRRRGEKSKAGEFRGDWCSSCTCGDGLWIIVVGIGDYKDNRKRIKMI